MNRKILDFVWNHKPAKIKKSTLIKSKKEGGLEMKDFVIFDKALKLNWVNRQCSDHDAPWKYIPTSLLANAGGAFLFQCNYSLQCRRIFGAGALNNPSRAWKRERAGASQK